MARVVWVSLPCTDLLLTTVYRVFDDPILPRWPTVHYNTVSTDLTTSTLLVQTWNVGETTLFIRQRMPGMNEIIRWAKTNPRWYAAEKRKWSTLVALYAREQRFQVIKEPAHFEFELWEPNRKRDPDNMCSGSAKFLLDALQDARLLEKDSWNWVKSLVFTWKQQAPYGVKVTVRT